MRRWPRSMPLFAGPVALFVLGSLLASGLAAWAAEPIERAGVALLPPVGEHAVWVSDRLLQHNLLYDGDTGEVMGMIDSPNIITPKLPLVSRSRNEIYSADVAYSRGLRGQRADFISIYDLRTLAYRDEVLLPDAMAMSNVSLAHVELLGDRFIGVFNQFPIVSVSIVDLERRAVVEKVVTTGCAGVYAVSRRRFASLCGDGTALRVELDEEGHLARRVSSKPFFDAVKDPVFMAAGRAGTRWTFVSFAGQVHSLDFGGESPTIEPAWSLLDEADRGRGWRPGGLQHVALHAASGRLFVVMHQGGPGSHKQAGPEIWVYSLAQHVRLARFGLPNLTAAFLAPRLGIELGSFAERVLDWVVPAAGAHSIAVTQDASPLLFARNAELGAVAVIDADTGKTLRVLGEAGLAGATLRVP